jgi:hypothetical protein
MMKALTLTPESADARVIAWTSPSEARTLIRRSFLAVAMADLVHTLYPKQTASHQSAIVPSRFRREGFLPPPLLQAGGVVAADLGGKHFTVRA